MAEERDGGLRLLPAGPAGQRRRAPLWRLLDAEFARAGETPAVRADDARIQEVRRRAQGELRRPCRSRHPRWPPARPGPKLGGVGARARASAAAARRRRHRLRRRLSHTRGRALGAARRSPSTVRRRARPRPALAERRKRAATSPGSAASSRSCRSPTPASMSALLSQTLHHAADPARASREAARVLRPGGRVLMLDLRAHGEAWVRDKLGDRWLGLRRGRAHGAARPAPASRTCGCASARARRRPVRGARRQRRDATAPTGAIAGPPCTTRPVRYRSGVPMTSTRPPRPAARRAHPRPRRRDGHDDPAPAS